MGRCDEPVRAVLCLSCPLLAPQAVGGTCSNFLHRWVAMGTPPLHGLKSLLWQKADHDRLVLQVLQVTATLPTAPHPLAETLAAHLLTSFFLCQRPNQHNPSSHPGSFYAVHSCHLEEETQCRRGFPKKKFFSYAGHAFKHYYVPSSMDSFQDK